MGNCIGGCSVAKRVPGLPNLLGHPVEDPIPALHQDICKDMKRVLGDGYFIRAKIASKMLAKADLQCAFDFVELQMLLPRRQCIETQVLVLTAAQLACCGMLLQQPSLNHQCSFVQNLCLHVLFEMRPLQVEAHGVALANLGRSLLGNTTLEKLSLNLMGLTLVTTSPVAKRIFQRVMESFAAMLCSNTTLRLLRFEGMMGADGEVPWSEADAELVCKAQAVHRGRARLVFLMGQHRRCKHASPLARELPHDLTRRVLDLAVPMRPMCKVEFDFFGDDINFAEMASLPAAII